MKDDNMNDNQIIIPQGWTYFAHRTNTERWDENPFEMKSIMVKKIMSVVTEREIYQDVSQYGKGGSKGYDRGNGRSFEIRTLICGLPYLRSLTDDMPIKTMMLKEFYYDRRNIGGAYGQRHHSIPEGEELMVLGIGTYDEVYNRAATIIWTIPKRFMDFYQAEINKDDNRVIDLGNAMDEKIR